MDFVISFLLPILFLIVFFYLLMVLPQKKAMKKREAMINALKAGDKVETISYVVGTIYEVQDRYVLLDVSQTSEKVRIKVRLDGINNVIEDEKSGDAGKK